MKTKEKTQNQQPIGYYSVCFYSLSGNPFPEENWLFDLKAKTYEGLVNKIKSVFESKYLKNKYYTVSEELQGNYPKDHPMVFTFEAEYLFGPEVQYYIYIKEIYSENLTD